MKLMLTALAAAMAFALGASPVQAQRTLDVPATAGWKHAETEIILMPRVGGMQRTKIADGGNAERDIAAELRDDDGKTWATLYIFRPALMSVPVWFDRSETLILHNDLLGETRPVDTPRAFAAPHATATSGLRRAYVPGSDRFKSTALAMMPLGEWLVVIRVTSPTLDPAQVDARLSAIIEGIGWPQGVAESPVAVPVTACAAPLAYAKRAKMKQPDMSDAIMGAAMAGPIVDEHGKTASLAALDPTAYCRDLPPNANYSVYRAPDVKDAYVIALADAGVVVRVGGGAMAIFGDSHGVSVSLADLYGTSIYPSFDKLPSPDLVMQALNSVSPMSRTEGDGKNITINAPSK